MTILENIENHIDICKKCEIAKSMKNLENIENPKTFEKTRNCKINESFRNILKTQKYLKKNIRNCKNAKKIKFFNF